MHVGTRCNIKGGPFKGLECVVQDAKQDNQNNQNKSTETPSLPENGLPQTGSGKVKIFVALHLLGQVVTTEIDRSLVEPEDPK